MATAIRAMVTDERRALLVLLFFRDCFRTKNSCSFRLEDWIEVLQGQGEGGVYSGGLKP
jgi:hypothetical protein